MSKQLSAVEGGSLRTTVLTNASYEDASPTGEGRSKSTARDRWEATGPRIETQANTGEATWLHPGVPGIQGVRSGSGVGRDCKNASCTWRGTNTKIMGLVAAFFCACPRGSGFQFRWRGFAE